MCCDVRQIHSRLQLQAHSQGGLCLPLLNRAPPPRSIEWSYTTNWAFYGLICGLQKCRGEAYDAPPDLLVGWGGGHQSQCPIPSAPSALRSSCPPPTDLELASVLSSWPHLSSELKKVVTVLLCCANLCTWVVLSHTQFHTWLEQYLNYLLYVALCFLLFF